MSKICTIALKQIFYNNDYSQATQGLECKIAPMGHAMNPIEKNVLFVFIYLVTLVFVPWNVLAPSTPKQRSF